MYARECPVQRVVREALDVCDSCGITTPAGRAEMVVVKLERVSERVPAGDGAQFVSAAALVRRLVQQ